ncbi:complex I 24 kDa subunit family protein [Dehalogenimonas alkenigignens]|uniref:NADH:ubiquinone oxidoreductase 24 kD subunit n=1 Tax=Dehalogenimonas alkenigignens TaxID=1217799 RepID=A0A0W0GIW6_9CHLR|nr:NAD(P)H-dependent oxidoreductase subunit E [Dehalogenimonas alkenigignens]KTB48505.1 NADH:ubiquinone oxidoreductase 24 kD subunit [Dehalogenimonas alkenigignens]PVV85047.1 NAD(P)H-dependent oxidoreductase subunit E [Dehalogenimonas alkenigignens]
MTLDTRSTAEVVNAVLAKYQNDSSMLVGILQDIQAELNYLPREALEMTAEVLSIPLSRVYSVATFFKAFSLKPRGRHGIHVCMGTACHVRGAEKVLDRFQTELCACAGETTPDMKFTLETVNCVGACALGPVVVVDGEYEGQVTAEKVKSIIEGCK